MLKFFAALAVLVAASWVSPAALAGKDVQIIDGTVPHALLLEIFTDTGVGTKIS